METKKLTEIRNNMSMLPGLKNKLKRIEERLNDGRKAVRELSYKLKEENHDVEKLRTDSLSVVLLKFVGKYDGKLDKEMQEALAAKLKYDKAVDEVTELEKEREEINSRIAAIEDEMRVYRKELGNRERLLIGNTTDQKALKYKQLEAERDNLSKLLFETKEASRAAGRVKNTAEEVIDELQDAEKWATFDTWTKGGIISHMAKYDHIDKAQEGINRLSSQLKELQKELSDVKIAEDFNITEIDSTTRIFDVWFDNIFTDLNIRSKIRGDLEELNSLYSKVGGLLRQLEGSESDINRKFEDIDRRKEDLLINSNLA